MTAEPRARAVHSRRRALWLFVFLGVLLPAGLCSPAVHAGMLRAAACAAPSAALRPAGTPDAEPPPAATGGAGRAADRGHPCTPPPRPQHTPCGALHRGSGPQRTAGPGQVGAGPPCPLVIDYTGGHTVRACPPRAAAHPPARRSGAGLLIDLCASRT